jgi:hypothetical protein
VLDEDSTADPESKVTDTSVPQYSPSQHWTDSIPVSPDVPAGKSLSAAFYGTSNLTVVYPLSDKSIEVAEYNTDKKFHDCMLR